ncbi:hypothetical protein FSARC_3356 [Fusarium sarcochroum]|uniref:Uncharacterized protein n=1 Tax=Fusarium sarcochroum TaxID=1208366 RepID=A0A8H4XCK7_9HYPO|nr:hypothetical protein FSARC_3356 [Fusarium sarcochroum]
MSAESQSFPILAAALQTYIDQGDTGPSVPTLECLDIALKTFRLEITLYHEGLPPGTICSGILLCAIYLVLVPSPEGNPAVRHAIEYLALADLPCLVMGRVCPSICLWKRYREVQDDWEGGRIMGVDDFTGLHMGLLDIYGDMMHDDIDRSVTRLWEWSSEAGDFLQRQLWDAWRASTRIPMTSKLLGMLIGAIQTIYAYSLLPENRHLLILNGLIYPFIVASLEVPSLRQRPEWKRTLDDARQRFQMGRTYALSRLTFQLLDEAWEEGSSCFDIDCAARRKGVELAVM